MVDTSLVFNVLAKDQTRDALKTMNVAFGTFFGNLATHAAEAGMRAGRALYDFTVDAIKGGADLVETQNKIKVVFGEAGDAVQSWASGAVQGMALTRQEAMDAAATFGVFGSAAGKAGQDLAAWSQELVGRAADMASFSNTGTPEAIEAISSALAGETEPIRKYGVTINDAMVKTKALEMGLLDTATSAAEMEKASIDVAKAQENLNKVMASGIPDIEDVARAQRDLKDAQEGVVEANERVAEKQADLNKLLGGAPADLDAVTDAEERLRDTRASAEAATRRVAEAQHDLSELMKTVPPDAEKVERAERRVSDTRDALADANEKVEIAQRKLTEAMKGAPLDAEKIARAEERLRDARDNLARSIERLDLEERKYQATKAGTPVDPEKVARAEGKYTDALFEQQQAQNKLAVATAKITEARNEWGDGSPRMLAAIVAQGDAQRVLESSTRQVSEASRDLAVAATPVAVTADDAAEAQYRLNEAQRQVADATDDHSKAEAELNKLMAAGGGSGEDLAVAQKRVEDAQQAAARAARNHEDAQKELGLTQQSTGPDAERVRDAQIKLEDAQRAAEKAARGQDEAQRTLAEVMGTAPADARKVEAAQRALEDAQDSAADAAEREQDAQNRLAKVMTSGTPSAVTLQDAQNKLALAQEKLAEKTAGATGELDPQKKALVVAALVMDLTQKQAGDFAATQGSLSNQTKILTATIEDQKDMIGAQLAPSIAGIMPVLSTLATSMGTDLAGKAGNLATVISTQLVPRMDDLKKLVEDGKKWWAEHGGEVMKAAGAFGAVGGAAEVLTPVLRILQILALGIGFAFGSTAGLIIMAIGAIGAAIYVLWNNNETFQTLFMMAWGIIRWAVEEAWKGIQWVFEQVGRRMEEAGAAAGRFAGWVREKWSEISGGAGEMVGWIGQHLDTVVGFFTELPGRVSGAAGRAFDWLSDQMGEVGGFIAGHLEGIYGFIMDIPRRISSLGGGMFNGLADAFKGTLNFFIEFWNKLDFRIPPVDVFGFSFGGTGDLIPNVTPLASGGIVPATRGGRLALLGEGGQDEAVIPLPRSGLGGGEVRWIVDARGSDEFTRLLILLIRKFVRIEGGGIVQDALGKVT